MLQERRPHPAPTIKRERKLAWKRKLKELKPDGPFQVQRIPDSNLMALRAPEDETTPSSQGEGGEEEDEAQAGWEGEHPAMDSLRDKLKEGGSKSKWYAKDELSKKILRHLTKHDRSAI